LGQKTKQDDVREDDEDRKSQAESNAIQGKLKYDDDGGEEE
jgi:hypothetical protein